MVLTRRPASTEIGVMHESTGLAIDHHRARTALSEAAAELRAVQLKIVR